ncbi:ATP-dependent helicase HrpB, partial [Exiguobacterium mexicanum]
MSEDILLCPLYGALSLKAQQQAIQIAPEGKRKVVLATNIAETSLTIEGIRLVMDSGLERVGQFNPRSGITKLVKQRISQASMTQRAGRAGRLEAGVCWHLFSEEQAERAAQFSEAQINQSDLSGLWLSLLQWGCHDVTQLSWLTLPPAPAIG